MGQDPQPFSLRARYVFPVAGPPIAGGVVSVLGDRIVGVGATSVDGPVTDLGDVAIVPGFVNAHTHLEFSDLTAPLGHPGMSLPEWIPLVVSQRRAVSTPPEQAIALGLRESVSHGTAALGEIATQDWQLPASTIPPPVHITKFLEALGPTPARALAATQSLDAYFAKKGTRLFNFEHGVSPHAPYTVFVGLLVQLIERARSQRAPVAMHLAESCEELELLRAGTGPFRELLEMFGVWDPDFNRCYGRPLGYLQQLAKATRALVVHGNYLDNEELAFLAQRADTMSVIFCPRTHAYFGHEAYPLAKMLAHGVRVALGTDSRASNPDLSLFGELQFAAMRHPDVSPRQLLQFATLGGAQALGIDDRYGSLVAGNAASFAVIRIDPRAATDLADPHELLLDPTARVESVWLHGQQVFVTPLE